MSRPFSLAVLAGTLAIGPGVSVLGDWPYSTGKFITGSPSVADVNGDGTLEILFGSSDGTLYCLDISGDLVWATPLYDPAGFPFPPQLRSSPTLVDLDGVPSTLEIVMGSYDSDIGGLLYCLAADGSVLATFVTETAVFCPPLVCDLENDGQLEIVFGDVRTQFGPPVSLYCVSVVLSKGEIQLAERWSVSALDGSVFGAAAASDFDADGVLEIVVSLGGTLNTSSDNSALFCLDSNGRVLWSFAEAGSFHFNTPAIGDIDGDSDLDVAVAPFHGDVYCLNAVDGDVEWVYEHAGGALEHSPALADLFGIGTGFNVVVGSYDGGGGGDQLYCMSPDGNAIWQNPFVEWTGFSSPGIADLDNDGDLEIAFATAGEPGGQGWIINGRMYLFSHDGQIVWERTFPLSIASSPALADLDGDGLMEIAFGCNDNNFYVLNAAGDTFVPNPNTKPTELAPWPTYRHNNQRTGYHARSPKRLSGDVDGDGIVNIDDLFLVIFAWGPCNPNAACPADLNASSAVDIDDLFMVVNGWT